MLRPFRRDDLGVLHDLVRSIESSDDFPLVTSAEELEEWLGASHISISADLPNSDVVLAEVDGRLVGWGYVDCKPAASRLTRAHLSGGVAAEFRRQGIGTQILEHLIQRGSGLLSQAPPGIPGYLRSDTYESEVAKKRMLEAHGFSEARWFSELLRPLEPSDIDLPNDPQGIQIVSWDPARNTESVDVFNASFADHWGTAPSTEDSWLEFLTGSNTRLDLSSMAVDAETGELVGFLISALYPEDEQLHGRKEGWIESLGTLASHRKRGIASALIRRSFAEFLAAGQTHAALGVDSASPTGANKLYENLGFEPMRLSCMLQREVLPEPTERGLCS